MKKNLKDILKNKLNKKEIEKLVRGFDIIGDIAITEIPESLAKKEKLIGKAILEMNNHIKTVLKKAEPHKGVFRTQKMKVIAGERKKVAEYKENNVRLRLDVEKVYFSPRLSTERKRIMELVKPKEDVLVMFSGCAPYVIVIAKNTKANSVYGVEINPVAHKYAIENVKLNKLNNVKLFEGDVRLVVPTLNKKFDRVLMPLPKEGENFLDIALKAVNKNGIVHFYDFLPEDEIKKAEEKVKNACNLEKKKCRILNIVKCGQIGPRMFRVCVDFRVS